MNQPSQPSTTAAAPRGETTSPSPSPTPTATETVTRPEPGIARGRWEAPAWAFWAILALVVVGATAYLLHRLGILKLRKARRDDAPPSSKVRRT